MNEDDWLDGAYDDRYADDIDLLDGPDVDDFDDEVEDEYPYGYDEDFDDESDLVPF